MNKLKKAFLALLLVLTGFGFGYAGMAFAALRVVQTPTYHLYTGETSVATTMRITPYPTDLDGVKLTITDLGTTPTVTVDPKVTGSEEIESFTGITDNGDNTATLSGLSRDLQSKYPYTGTGTGRSHGSGATVVFGNNPQIYGRLAAMENDNTWTGAQTFNGQTTFSATNIPVYSSTPTFGSNGNVLVNKAYVDSGLLNGAATSTYGNQGLVQLANDAQIQASTASSTNGSPLVIPSRNASSTYGISTRAGIIPVLRVTKDIDPNFIATSTATTYNFAALMNFNATTTFNFGLIDVASSSIIATTTFVGPLINAGLVTAFTAAETITAGTPVAVTASSTLVFKAISTLASTTQYIGIAKTAANAGQTVYVQTTGVYIGLGGLSVNEDYYSNDSAAISATRGTIEIYVGRGLTATSLLIITDKSGQYNGSLGGASGNVPAYTRYITVSPMVANSTIFQGGGGTGYLTKDNPSAVAQGSTCCSLNSGSWSVTWTPPTDIRYPSTMTASLGGNATSGGGTAYFYR